MFGKSYLVVAYKTLMSPALADELRWRDRMGPCRFHVVVPLEPPARGAWTDENVRVEAKDRLSEALVHFSGMGLQVTGEIGDGHPIDAVNQVLERGDPPIAEVILSTLPPGVSRWLELDVYQRLVDAVFPIPVHHVIASSVLSPAGE